jgi:hypothetical protein
MYNGVDEMLTATKRSSFVIAGAALAAIGFGDVLLSPLLQSTGVARASEPVHTLPPLLDEPFLVQQTAGQEASTTVRAAMWPTMFSLPFRGEDSQLCIGCEISPGEFELVATDTLGSVAPRRVVGRISFASAPQVIPWLPSLPPQSFDSVANSTVFSNFIQSDSMAVTAFVRSNSGHWTYASGLLVTVNHEITASGESEGHLTKVLMPLATHANASAAGEWLSAFVGIRDLGPNPAAVLTPHTNQQNTIDWIEAYLAGDILVSRPVMMPWPGGPTPNLSFWNCLAGAKNAHDTAVDLARFERDQALALLTPFQSITNYTGVGIAAGAAGGVYGATQGGGVLKQALRCTPLGRLIGNGPAGGVIGGTIGGLLTGGIGVRAAYEDRAAQYRLCEVKEKRARDLLLQAIAACYRDYGPMWM